MSPLVKAVIKAHILTGDDCMSKVGTKHAAMVSDLDLAITSLMAGKHLGDFSCPGTH